MSGKAGGGAKGWVHGFRVLGQWQGESQAGPVSPVPHATFRGRHHCCWRWPCSGGMGS